MRELLEVRRLVPITTTRNVNNFDPTHFYHFALIVLLYQFSYGEMLKSLWNSSLKEFYPVCIVIDSPLNTDTETFNINMNVSWLVAVGGDVSFRAPERPCC